MKKIIIFIFILAHIQARGQTAERRTINAQSGTSAVNNFYVSWSLGEPIVGITQAGNSTLTQGFQQPDKNSVTCNIGSPCDDGNPNTTNDKIQNDCSCLGSSRGDLTLICPNDTVVIAKTGQNSAVIRYKSPIVSSTCTRPPIIITSSGGDITNDTIFPIGTTVRTITATDPCGNKKTCSFTVTVQSSAFQTLSISLKKGWNTISSYVQPTDSNMVDVIRPIAQQVDIVKNGEGKIYVPSANLNQIGNWNITQGYQIKLKSDATLTISGQKRNTRGVTIPIKTGWQIISNLSAQEELLPNILNKPNIILVKNNAGAVYIPSTGVNTILKMQPTQGYFIKANANGTIIFPNLNNN